MWPRFYSGQEPQILLDLLGQLLPLETLKILNTYFNSVIFEVLLFVVMFKTLTGNTWKLSFFKLNDPEVEFMKTVLHLIF